MYTFYKVVDSNFNINELPYKSESDFSGLYLQTSEEHALCYLEHRAELAVTDTIYLAKFTLLTDYYKIDDELFGRPDIPAAEKAKILKLQFNIPDEKFLIESLDKPIMMLDNPNDYELIIPHHLKHVVRMNIMRSFNIKIKNICGTIFKIAMPV